MTTARPRPLLRPGSARSSAASADSTSRSRPYSVAKWSGKVKSTRTRATSCSGGGPRLPTSGTSKRCSTSRLRKSSAVGSPARTSAAPGQARDCVDDEAVSGSSLPEPFARRHRSSWSWKTSGACAVAGSTKSSRTWPKQGSMRNGQAFERPTSAPRTVAKGCSSWPTPTGTSCGALRGGSGSGSGRARCPGQSRLSGDGSWWPTPCASDARDSARHTVRADAPSHRGTSLTDKMRQWGTRRAPKTGKPGPSGRRKAVLNPGFVEILLGLPEGYTLVDDAAAYDALEDRSCHSKRQRLF